MWKDSKTKIDFLDCEYLKNTLVDIIADKKLSPSSIGIYGDWGSGKSSLIEMSMEELSKENDTLCIKFNSWLFEGYEDAKTALIGTILDKISEKKTPTGKAKEILTKLYKNTDKLKLAKNAIKYGVDFFSTGGIGTIADITMNGVFEKVKETVSNVSTKDVQDVLQNEFKSEEVRKDIKSFHKDFSELLELTKIEKLVVFIDELDRCNPNTILDTLEAIRLFIFTNNTSFIIGADERHVMYAVKKKYSEIDGHQIDIGKEYLEKLIQYPIRIPQLSQKEIELYIMCLFFENTLNDNEFSEMIEFIKSEKQKDFINFDLTYEKINDFSSSIAQKSKESISLAKQLSSVLAVGLKGNPRHCKRFLNSLSMRMKMGSFRQIQLDQRILAKLMLLEYFKVDFFKKLAEVQSKEGGKPSELNSIEKAEWENSESFLLWKDDSLVQDWLNTEPFLTGVDLRPYFYFSRESLASQFNIAQLRLSPQAEKVLSDLLTGAESKRKLALKATASINDSEASIILNKLSDKITSSSKIESSIFKSFIKWGESKNILHTSVISCLNEIPGKHISITLVPSVKGFMDKTGKKKEIYEAVVRWAKENSRLEKAITQNFGDILHGNV